MYETIKSLILAGLGAAVVTRDKVLELANQFVDQGRMKAADAEKLADEVMEESRRQAGQLKEKLDQAAASAVAALNLASREELLALQARVAALEGELAALKAAPSKPEAEFNDQG